MASTISSRSPAIGLSAPRPPARSDRVGAENVIHDVDARVRIGAGDPRGSPAMTLRPGLTVDRRARPLGTGSSGLLTMSGGPRQVPTPEPVASWGGGKACFGIGPVDGQAGGRDCREPEARVPHVGAVLAHGRGVGAALHEVVQRRAVAPGRQGPEPGLGVAPSQGPADLGSWRSGGLGGDLPARMQGGRQRWPHAATTGGDGTSRHGCGWEGQPGQAWPDSAQRITEAVMLRSAILGSTGNFSSSALRWLPATRSLSAGRWCLPAAAGWQPSGPHARRPVE